ncbi:MAG: hypothetical protein R3F43_03430 [bacterium]
MRKCDDGNLDNGDGCSDACTLEVVAAPTPIAAPNASIQLAGSLDAADPRWARPSANCSPTVGVDHPYDAIRIVNDTGRDQIINLTAAWAGGDLPARLHRSLRSGRRRRLHHRG